MKKYKVDIWSEETYKKVFEANNKKEAEKLARKEIDEMGVNYKNDWETGFNADWNITSVREIK